MKGTKHTVAVAVLVALSSALLVAFFLNTSLTPLPASTQAGPVDRLLRIMFSIGGVILALCPVLLVYSTIAFRRRPGDTPEGPPVEGNPPWSWCGPWSPWPSCSGWPFRAA